MSDVVWSTTSRRVWVPLVGATIAFFGVLAAPGLVGAYVRWLWLGAVGYRVVFTTIACTRVVLFVAVGVVVAGTVWLAMEAAFRARPVAGGDPRDWRMRWVPTLAARPRLLSAGVALPTAVVAGWVAQHHWALFQMCWHSTSFDLRDPVFGLDASFYAFVLPCYRLVLALTMTVVGLCFLLVLGIHCLCGGLGFDVGVAQKRSVRIGVDAYRQLVGLAAVFLPLKAVSCWLDRYSLLLAHHNSVFDGATYTDIHAVLPAKTVLSVVTLGCAGLLLVAMVRPVRWLPPISVSILILSSIALGAAWPAVIHRFVVQPHVNEHQSVPISHNIAATLEAFDLTARTVIYSNYQNGSSSPRYSPNSSGPTLANLPLLDPSRLSDTFTQLRQRKQFYGFSPSLAVERYRLNGNLRAYLVAARQLDPTMLTGIRGNWVNKHLVFTHGNGLVAAPMNQVSGGSGGQSYSGCPRFVDTYDSADSPLRVDQPRIYYSPLMVDDYSIVGGAPGAAPREYDTPIANFSYAGRGGVPLGSLFNRLMVALHLGDPNILLSDSVTAHSKILLIRDPRKRVQKVAPWLTLDRAPYPAVVDGRIVWIVDGYTTLADYPYANHVQLRDVTSDGRPGLPTLPATSISYLRNSVKATVDAYDGTVTLYAFDPRDPVLRTWEKVFPGTVRPASALKSTLWAHLHYPQDQFEVQRALLTRYHVADPKAFSAGAGAWNVPRDPTVDTISPQPPHQAPNYQITTLPGAATPSFQLTSPVTSHDQRQVSNYLSASYDSSGYGQIRVLRIPPDARGPGPRLQQNQYLAQPNVRDELTALESAHNQIDYGSLTITPVAGGLLYTEPIYIQQAAADDSYPHLYKILASFGGKTAYSSDFKSALDRVLESHLTLDHTLPGSPVFNQN